MAQSGEAREESGIQTRSEKDFLLRTEASSSFQSREYRLICSLFPACDASTSELLVRRDKTWSYFITNNSHHTEGTLVHGLIVWCVCPDVKQAVSDYSLANFHCAFDQPPNSYSLKTFIIPQQWVICLLLSSVIHRLCHMDAIPLFLFSPLFWVACLHLLSCFSSRTWSHRIRVKIWELPLFYQIGPQALTSHNNCHRTKRQLSSGL